MKSTTYLYVLSKWNAHGFYRMLSFFLATQRNDFGFIKCELKSLNNVGYCGQKKMKSYIAFLLFSTTDDFGPIFPCKLFVFFFFDCFLVILKT